MIASSSTTASLAAFAAGAGAAQTLHVPEGGGNAGRLAGAATVALP